MSIARLIAQMLFMQACKLVVSRAERKAIEEIQRVLAKETQLWLGASEEDPQRTELSPLLLKSLRHLLEARLPVLYVQVLEPTLSDLRQEHFAALTKGRPCKARCVLLRGCGSLATAAACQLGYSLLGRIAALWQARSPK
jgi:hypothetical protein